MFYRFSNRMVNSVFNKEKNTMFQKENDKKENEINTLKDEMSNVRKRTLKCVDEMEKLRDAEMKMLTGLKEKYNLNDEEIINLIRKIVTENE